MMFRSRKTRSKLAMTLAAALAGGSVFGACETRLRTAVVEGTKNYFFSFLDPELFLEFINDLPDQTTGR